MRTKPTISAKISAFKQFFNTLASRNEAWELVEREDNAGFIVENLEHLLTPQTVKDIRGILFITEEEQNAVNLFKVCSIICLNNKQLFPAFLKYLNTPDTNFEPLITQMFAYLGKRRTIFEVALIISTPEACNNVTAMYNKLALTTSTTSFVNYTLAQCNAMNLSFNSILTNQSLSALKQGVMIGNDSANLTNSLPSSCHGRLLLLIHTMLDTPFCTLYTRSKPSFRKFVPQAIALQYGLPPLSPEDETTFLDSMHLYFSMSGVCKDMYGLLITRDINVSDSCLIHRFVLNNILQNTQYQSQEFGVGVAQIWDLIPSYNSPYNTLKFCEQYIGRGEPPTKKARVENSCIALN